MFEMRRAAWLWKDQSVGLHWHARVYNAFSAPILGCISQLDDPPAWALEGADQALLRVAKGPGNWAEAMDLWTFR